MDFPKHIKENLSKDKTYYSMYRMDNIERCKEDPAYLGDVLLVNENLIWHSVHKYIGKPETIADNNGLEKEDILQLGRMGYIKAIKAFDTTRGIKFSSFAVTAIVREIRCFLRDTANIIRLTRTAHSLLMDIRKVENDFGYMPSVEDLAMLLDEKEEKITKVLQIGQPVKSLEGKVTYPLVEKQRYVPDTCLMDLLHADENVEIDVVDKVYVDSIIDSIRAKLTDTEVNVLNSQMEGNSQTQTAREYNISQMRVSRIIKKIAKLIDKYTDV
jgi:RNA polymerase sigma factor (sigma-70 family)